MTIMHGPALDGSGETKEQDVHPDNVPAMKAARWIEGEMPKGDEPEVVEEVVEAKPKKAARKGR